MRPVAGILAQEVERAQHAHAQAQWEELRATLQSCGAGVVPGSHLTITHPRYVSIGNNVRLGDRVKLVGEGGLTIGHDSQIGDDVRISTSDGSLPRANHASMAPVAIGRNVHIQDGAQIRPGVKIGDDAIIRPGAVITDHVPAKTIVGPAPQRSLGGAPGARGAAVDHKPAGIFFVASTGRSGTMTIAHSLSQHPQITCLHDLRWQLIRLSTELEHQLKDRAAVESELRSIYCDSTVYPDGIYGESDQVISNMMTMLSQVLPESRFIWLIRDGRDFVASAWSRGWWGAADEPPPSPEPDQRQPWALYRPNAASIGVIKPNEWQAMTSFEKNCWYWSYWNERIDGELKQLPKSRWFFVRLEELQNKLPELFEFLGVPPFAAPVERLNAAIQDIHVWQKWTPEQQSSFERWCGKSMDRWYPGWRK